MSNKKDRNKFKCRLAGELVNWKEYALHLEHILSQAEIREKNFCWESRYFYEQCNEMYMEMGLTEEEIDYVCDEYIKWAEENKKI